MLTMNVDLYQLIAVFLGGLIVGVMAIVVLFCADKELTPVKELCLREKLPGVTSIRHLLSLWSALFLVGVVILSEQSSTQGNATVALMLLLVVEFICSHASLRERGRLLELDRMPMVVGRITSISAVSEQSKSVKMTIADIHVENNITVVARESDGHKFGWHVGYRVAVFYDQEDGNTKVAKMVVKVGDNYNVPKSKTAQPQSA